MKAQKLAMWMGVVATFPAMAWEPTVQLNWRYEEAKNGRVVRGTVMEAVPTEGRDWKTTDEAMIATVLVTRLSNSIESSLKSFEKACESIPVKGHEQGEAIRPFGQGVRVLPPNLPRPFPIPTPEIPADCLAKRTKIAQTLLEEIGAIQKEWSDAGLTKMKAMEEATDMARKLAKNMKDAKTTQPVGPENLGGGFGKGFGGARLTAAAPSAGALNIGTGGAQDYGYFRKLVSDGYVPKAETFLIEGFLAEFPLSLPFEKCEDTVCLRPGIAVNKDGSKMYVQLAMGSKITPATFKRAPLNLALVLDISGSMSATDDTEKNRLEWAKDALIHAIENLNEEDYVSIVTFDSVSEVVVPATPVSDKKALIEKVKALKTRGSTNLHAGLQDGFEQITKFQDKITGYENRVILISDAWLNTGVTEDAPLTKLVGDFAAQKVGLTAIGVGAQFNQKFIESVSNSQGGNYVYVHSGRDMLRYFESFGFLVTPVAYNFRADLTLSAMDAKLVKAYGVPAKVGETIQKLISVPTLFFSHQGGAIVLEYDIKN